MLPLLKRLFAIVLLRKGPEDLPRSAVLLVLIIAIWFFSALASLALIEPIDESDFFLGVFSAAVGVICYASLVVVSGHAERLTQTISAIIGCGALITFIFIAEYVLLLPLFGPVTTGLLANLILLWSVPVEGHIIARAIDRDWYIGILIAVLVFGLQLIIYKVITASP